MHVRPLRDGEREWLADEVAATWGSPRVVSRGRVHEPASLPTLVCEHGGDLLGFAAYEIAAGGCELVAIAVKRRGEGVGTALFNAVARVARGAGCHHLWVVATNDDVDALRFYQRRGMRLATVHRGAVDEARRLEPEIPTVGEHGIGLHDEVELDLEL